MLLKITYNRYEWTSGNISFQTMNEFEGSRSWILHYSWPLIDHIWKKFIWLLWPRFSFVNFQMAFEMFLCIIRVFLTCLITSINLKNIWMENVLRHDHFHCTIFILLLFDSFIYIDLNYRLGVGHYICW